MSDSEDDFMSDKFLVDIPSTGGSSSGSNRNTKSYTEKRNIEQLKSMRKGQSNNKIPLKQLEEQRRREGLSKSLFDQGDTSDKLGSSSSNLNGDAGGNVAIGLMKKMGWNVGESLGKRRSSPPPASSSSTSGRSGGNKRPKFLPGDEEEEEEESTQRGGIGSSSSTTKGRVEPIRISMWSGRKGLTAREPSPPPLPTNLSGRNPDALDPEKLKRLGKETDSFRERQRVEYGEREKERKGRAAREKLREFDAEKGIKFHPLHILPFSPLNTIPRPLLKLIYPSQVFSPSSSPPPSVVEGYEKESNLSAAEKIREQMRRDMLSNNDNNGSDEEEEGEGILKFGILKGESKDEYEEQSKKLKVENLEEVQYKDVKWEDHVNGAKRVLAMDPSTYLQFVVDQLRNEHLFCFWCAYKYTSFEEMDGSGGCPGEEEDDH